MSERTLRKVNKEGWAKRTTIYSAPPLPPQKLFRTQARRFPWNSYERNAMKEPQCFRLKIKALVVRPKIQSFTAIIIIRRMSILKELLSYMTFEYTEKDQFSS